MSLDLRPSLLDHVGLLSALRWLVESLHCDTGINAEIEIKGENRKLKPENEVIMFRIVQEALNNVRRHSKATNVKVNTMLEPDVIKITVQDNGIGFEVPETTSLLTAQGKLGLAGMRERTRFLHGTLNVYSEPNKGTLVSVEIPGAYNYA